jgi:two-component system, OmpR family, alkaline phosphatase synthesis response regulator PhoP
MASRGLKKKIVLIEDEENLVKALTIRLRANGYEVAYAFDALQGVQKIHKEKPDLIILDIRIPGGDGFLVAQRLKNSTFTKDIPIIFLTGLPESEGKKKALELGAKFYVQKPYNPEDLLDMIQSALAMGEDLKGAMKKGPRKRMCFHPNFSSETAQAKPLPAELKPCKCGLSLKCPVCGYHQDADLCRCADDNRKAGKV